MRISFKLEKGVKTVIWFEDSFNFSPSFICLKIGVGLQLGSFLKKNWVGVSFLLFLGLGLAGGGCFSKNLSWCWFSQTNDIDSIVF